MTAGGRRPHLRRVLGLARVLAGAALGALVLHLLAVPAGVLLGAVIGSACPR